jgi:hypothetical protein
MTALATKKAAKISNMKFSENPENAFSVVIVFVSTAMIIAKSAAIKMGKAFSNTDRMALKNKVKRCQAWILMSQGIGAFQIPMATATTINLFPKSFFKAYFLSYFV